MRIPAGASGRELRWAQEDAWAEGRVQRRWVQFVVQLSQDEAEQLLQALVDAGLAGVRTLVHEHAAAPEGWALPSQGRLIRATPARPAALRRRPALPPAAQMR